MFFNLYLWPKIQIKSMIPYFSPTILIALSFLSCQNPKIEENADQIIQDSLKKVEEAIRIKAEEESKKPLTAADIILVKDIVFEKYSLEDNYKYNKKDREFQWEKIKEKLAYIENFQRERNNYAVISNYKNKNKEAPLVTQFNRNSYGRIADTLGTERYQSVPLYKNKFDEAPTIYGKDGSLVKIIAEDTTGIFVTKGLTNFEGEWCIPKRYIRVLGDTILFRNVVVVDVTNQNICTIEHQDKEWRIKSMNPATTGKYNPPYAMKTPVGIYLIQEKKPKMFYYKDGTTTIQGYAPWASRFTNGAYIHGVPTADPKAAIIEYSWTLGTTPRSHMCVRNASSHAKFIYNWMVPQATLVVVID